MILSGGKPGPLQLLPQTERSEGDENEHKRTLTNLDTPDNWGAVSSWFEHQSIAMSFN